jgi:hypothetical protein
MHIATTVEQSFTFTSGGNAIGKSQRTNTLPTMNVPGPGSYNLRKEIREPRTMSKVKDEVEPEDLGDSKLKRIPRAPAPAKTVMVKEQLDGKKEVERVDLTQYKDVAEWKETGDWAKARLRQSQKARDEFVQWT